CLHQTPQRSKLFPYTTLFRSKAVTIFPNNPQRGLSTTQGVVLLSDTSDGKHVATLNASYLTRLRTGAISGLATDYLALEDAKTLDRKSTRLNSSHVSISYAVF